MAWGEEHEQSPDAERAAIVKDCVDAMRAAVAVYDEMIPKLGEARVKLARRLLELEGVDLPQSVSVAELRESLGYRDFEREAALQAEPGRMVDSGGGIMSMTAPLWEPVPDADGAASRA